MNFFQYIIFIFSILIYSGCDKQSNPFIGSNNIAYQENLMGESRDIIVLEDVEFDVYNCSLLNEEDCNNDLWCSYDQGCISKPNDLLIVANQYEEGLIVYQIIEEENSVYLNKIYQNNSFEVLDESSLENDLELRTLLYSDDSNMLYILDKFEYIYNGWLPGLLESTTQSYSDECYDYDSNLIWDPIQFTVFSDISNLHSTQIVMDESNIGNLDEALYLIKYNSNIISQQNLPAPLKTSSSKLGAYSFALDPTAFGPESACDGLFFTTYVPDISPHFDYNITDIFFKNNKVFIANPYNEYVFKDASGNYLNLNYKNNEYEDVANGCDLPDNSIYFSDNGELLYNTQNQIGYFEFNLYGGDLSSFISGNVDCSNFQDNGNYIQYPSDCFEGEISSNNNYSVGISGNKVIGYSIITSNIDSNCGTLIDLNTSENFSLVNEMTSTFSVYDYNSNSNYIEFNYDIETPSKVKSIYSFNDYILVGLYDEGCYITLLGDNTNSLVKLEGTNSFTVNDIYYDEINQILLLSAGSGGVLIYNWNGLSANPNFLGHVVSSHAYTARMLDGKYIIIATKYGVEIYNYENI